MNGDHPTSGDYAWAEASRNSDAVRGMRQKIAKLEKHHDFLVDVVNFLLDDYYGPSDVEKPDGLRKMIKEFTDAERVH